MYFGWALQLRISLPTLKKEIMTDWVIIDLTMNNKDA
jgi:hypothetical protein